MNTSYCDVTNWELKFIDELQLWGGMIKCFKTITNDNNYWQQI